jgi:hypothetical protein
MMETFDVYSPAKWLRDGLVVTQTGKAKAFKVNRRQGTLCTAFSAAALFVAVSQTTMTILGDPTGVGNIKAYGGASSLTGDQIVPLAYWDKLTLAMRAAPRLPDQNSEFDPPGVF